MADAAGEALERMLSLDNDAVNVSGIGSGSDSGATEMLRVVSRDGCCLLVVAKKDLI